MGGIRVPVALNYAVILNRYEVGFRGRPMWSVVFIATAFFAITFAVVSYSMREVHKRGKAGWPR